MREVVFPAVGEETLRDLVKEWKATGPTYRTTLCTVIRNSYQGHYRRMVPKLLAALEFRSKSTPSWLFFLRRGGSTRMTQILVLRSRLGRVPIISGTGH